MLREASVTHDTDWAEKTMSELREKQFEACERRLSAFPAMGLFSPLASDLHAQALLERSFYHNEAGNDGLVSLDALRKQVLAQLPLEALYLSNGESVLLERLLVADGHIHSANWDEIDAAEALARRLWCTFSTQGEHWALDMPEMLRMPLLKAYNDPLYTRAKARLYRFDATISGLLYIAGFLHAAQPLHFFMDEVMERSDALAQSIAYRYLKATFEYIADTNHEIILVHPGLADPNRLISMMNRDRVIALTLNEDTLAGGMSGMLPEEESLHQMIRAVLDGFTRPEWEADEAAEDLRLLAKQGVPLQDMTEVMASMLCVQATDTMHLALRRLHESTPRWIGMTAALRH